MDQLVDGEKKWFRSISKSGPEFIASQIVNKRGKVEEMVDLHSAMN